MHVRWLLTMSFFYTVSAVITTLSNVHPRLDNTSQLFDAHDGSTRRFEPNGPFYYHAMGYGTECIENGKSAAGGCGQLSNNTVGIWRSPTLASGTWEKLASFTPSLAGWPNCTYFRSQVLRSPTTNLYVLWLNAQAGHDNTCAVCPEGSAAKCFVAGTSASPAGPFVYQGVVPDVRYMTEGGVGDYALFQDDDEEKTAYVIYKRSGAAPGAMAHRMSMQRLLPNLLAAENTTAASAGIFGAPFVEAPAMFKRKNVYYSLFGQCCAFCAHGTGIGVYSSSAPLGPWMMHSNIGCEADESLPPECGCGSNIPPQYNVTCPKNVAAVTFAQQNSVIMTGDDEVVWTGDRWQSACAETVRKQGLPATDLPVKLDCIKGYDLQYWSVLRWDDTKSPPLPRQIEWEDEIKITVS